MRGLPISQGCRAGEEAELGGEASASSAEGQPPRCLLESGALGWWPWAFSCSWPRRLMAVDSAPVSSLMEPAGKAEAQTEEAPA